MKKALPVMFALAVIAAPAAASPIFLQDSGPAAAQADDPEAAANAAYKAWKAETDQAKKLEMGTALVSTYFGSKAAEAVGYAGMFDQGATPESKLAMSLAYYNASVAAGKDGAYNEYALGNLATLSKDPKKIEEYGEVYLQKYPTGRYAPYVQKAVVAAHYGMFDAALKEKRYPEAIQYGSEMLAKSQDGFIYAYRLSSTGLGDETANGAKSVFLGKISGWADKGIAYVEAGSMPEGADKDRWAKDKPTTLALLYKAKGVDMYYKTAQSNPPSADAYAPAIDALKKSLTFNEKDPITYYFLSQVYNTQYADYSKKFEALPAADQTGDPGKAVLEKVNTAADDVINSLVHVIAYAGENKALKDTVQPQLVEYWKYRHPDAPDAWQDEIKKVNGSAPSAPAQ